jgi:hypothetical protein
MAPWSIYPFALEDCAAILCDLLIFETTISVDDLIASLERVGMNGEIFTSAYSWRGERGYEYLADILAKQGINTACRWFECATL